MKTDVGGKSEDSCPKTRAPSEFELPEGERESDGLSCWKGRVGGRCWSLVADCTRTLKVQTDGGALYSKMVGQSRLENGKNDKKNEAIATTDDTTWSCSYCNRQNVMLG